VRVERRDHRDQFAHAEVLHQRAGLQHPADVTGLDRVAGREAEDRDGALVGPGQSQDHVCRGGLAGAVGTEQRHDLARSDSKVDAAHRSYGAE
jgi:hypothetical protein